MNLQIGRDKRATLENPFFTCHLNFSTDVTNYSNYYQSLISIQACNISNTSTYHQMSELQFLITYIVIGVIYIVLLVCVMRFTHVCHDFQIPTAITTKMIT